MANKSSSSAIETTEKRVSCDGGGGALGHPKVYFEFKPGESSLICSYCGQEFRRVSG